ncbi:ribonuclease H-like domain-containing protein [Tanacetum coccineum]
MDVAVNLNGDEPVQTTKDENGVETEVPPKTAQAILARQKKEKLKAFCFWLFLMMFEADIKGSSGSSSNSQNVTFLSAEDTSSSNEVNTANSVSTASEEAILQGNVEHQEIKGTGIEMQGIREGTTPEGLYIAQDEPTEFALMAYTSNSSGSDTEANLEIIAYQSGLESVEAQILVNGVNTAGQTTVCTVKRNGVTAIKASAGESTTCFKYKGMFDSGCFKHMTGNKALLTDYLDIDGGFVVFGGGTRGGKITRIGKIRTNKIDFEDVFFVKELKFNLFSVSQMCDKKNNVLFTETEYLVLSPDFKLIDESPLLLRVPRQNNMYIFDLKNVVPTGDLTCLFVKAIIDECKLWHRSLGHVNFKTMNKLMKGNLVRVNEEEGTGKREQWRWVGYRVLAGMEVITGVKFVPPENNELKARSAHGSTFVSGTSQTLRLSDQAFDTHKD